MADVHKAARPFPKPHLSYKIHWGASCNAIFEYIRRELMKMFCILSDYYNLLMQCFFVVLVSNGKPLEDVWMS